MYKTCFGDDLGSQWYLFHGHSVARCVNWIQYNLMYNVLYANRDKHTSGYEIVEIKVWRKYWIFGEIRVSILLENAGKISKLKNSQHYSELHPDHPVSMGLIK